jgi:signal transduction histidine kinase
MKGGWRRLNVQFAVWYTAIFAAGAFLIFAASYFMMSSFLVREDRDFVRDRSTEFQSRLDDGGVKAMLSEIQEETGPGFEPLFVRVCDAAGRPLFSNGAAFTRFDASPLLRKPQPVPTWIRLKEKDDEDTLDVLCTLLPDGSWLQVGKPSHERNTPLERFTTDAFAVAIPVLLLGIAGGAFLFSRVFRPVRELVRTLNAISETGALAVRVPERGTRDELDDLVLLFNRMLGRIESVVDGMRRALDTVAHDLRTPMTRLRNTAEEALHAEMPSEQHREALADCLEQSEDAVRVLELLMDISEAETGTLRLKPESLAAADIAADVVDLYRHVAEEKNVTLDSRVPDGLLLTADRLRLRQALANVVDNAIKFTPSGGTVTVDAEAADGQVRIAVTDTGAGIGETEIPRIWERLYRGEAGRRERGMGLGLSLVRAIVEAHRGRVDVRSERGRGSRFVISLPAERREA